LLAGGGALLQARLQLPWKLEALAGAAGDVYWSPEGPLVVPIVSLGIQGNL
jgi:hypothetical protein